MRFIHPVSDAGILVGRHVSPLGGGWTRAAAGGWAWLGALASISGELARISGAARRE